MAATKKFMYVNRHAPYGTVYALEGLEVVLVGAAFEQDVSMAFIGDGVFQLKKGQDTSDSDMKNFSPAYKRWVTTRSTSCTWSTSHWTKEVWAKMT
jgi:tRNA 2-thiouridine synthesizing protein C